jgi:hypothetical protein
LACYEDESEDEDEWLFEFENITHPKENEIKIPNVILPFIPISCERKLELYMMAKKAVGYTSIRTFLKWRIAKRSLDVKMNGMSEKLTRREKRIQRREIARQKRDQSALKENDVKEIEYETHEAKEKKREETRSSILTKNIEDTKEEDAKSLKTATDSHNPKRGKSWKRRYNSFLKRRMMGEDKPHRRNQNKNKNKRRNKLARKKLNNL